MKKISVLLSRLFHPRPVAYYLLNLRAFYVYKNFFKDYIVSFLCDLSNTYPRWVAVRTNHRVIPLYASNHGDMMTINEVFVWKCYPYTSKSTDVILDLGSNTGLSSAFFLASNPHSSVLQYEPNTHLTSVQQLNLKTFEAHRYATRAMAIGSEPGLGTLIETHHSRYTSLQPISSTTNDNAVPVQTLQYAILDAQNTFGSCDILKIDIEGFGFIALNSLPHDFNVLPRTIFIEEHLDPTLELNWLSSNYTKSLHPSGVYIFQRFS